MNDYSGYPVFPLRVTFISLNAFSMIIFGTNETATQIFPLLFSILNILLTYKLAQLVTENKTIALFAAFLITFFPTDIIFATICFPDLINVFFISLGFYFLIKSYKQKKYIYSYFGGISLFLSMQIKEHAYYVLILLTVLFVYSILKSKQFKFQILIGILFIILNYLIEGFTYLLLHNDFFYRITITNINYSFSYYDFFPYTTQKLSGSKNYFRNVFDQIVLINLKSIFLRRFYLFLPLITTVQTFFSHKKKEHSIILFWFWGTAILLIAFTTSFIEYKPLDLARSWYIYPLLMPMIILSSIFLDRFSKFMKIGLMFIYVIGSIIMCFEYENFFDKENLNSLKSFLRENTTQTIYTDHFTKYSIDLICEYRNNSKRIQGAEFDFDRVEKGEWILYNNDHIKELEMQKYNFPDFSILNSNGFKKVASFNSFVFYEKLY